MLFIQLLEQIVEKHKLPLGLVEDVEALARLERTTLFEIHGTLWNDEQTKIPNFQDIQAAAKKDLQLIQTCHMKCWGKFGTPKSYSLHDPLTHINSTDTKLLGLCELSMVEQSYGKVQVKHVVGIHLDGLAARLARQASNISDSCIDLCT